MRPARYLSLPHRALRSSAVRRFHAYFGVVTLVSTVSAAVLYYPVIWRWQGGFWQTIADRFGIPAVVNGAVFGWDQRFMTMTVRDLWLAGFGLLLFTWLVFRSTLIPTIKGLFVLLALPLFLYALVTYWIGEPPVGALAHTGPEWLIGEMFVWCLIPLLYAIYLFPLPMRIWVKFASLLIVLGMAIIWRTATPAIYMLITYYSGGVLAIQAWMLLGPWFDFIYIIPMYAATLALYKGGHPGDYRT